MLKKLLLSLLLVLILTPLAIGGTIYWAATHPKKAFALVEKYILPKDLKITWVDMHFSTQKTNWHHWDIDWNTHGLKINKGAPELNVPIDLMGLTFTLRVFEEGPWLAFQEVRLQAGDQARFRSSAPSASKSPEQSPFQMLKSYLGYLRVASRWASVDKMNVDVPRFAIESDPETTTYIQIHLLKPIAPDRPTQTAYHGAVDAGTFHLALEGWVDGTKLDGGEPFLNLQVLINGVDWRTRTDLVATDQGEKTSFTGHSNIIYGDGKKPIEAQPKIRLEIDARQAILDVHAAVKGIPGPVVKVDDLRIEARVPLENDQLFSKSVSTFKVWTPVDMFFVDKNMRPPLEDSCHCKIPEKLMLSLTGDAWLDALTSTSKKRAKVVEAKLAIDSVSNKLISADVAARVRIDKEAGEWIVEPRLDSKLTIESFQGMRQFLDARNIMVPAPLDVLDGKVSLTAIGAVDRSDKLFKTAVEVKVDLASRTQKVDVETTINLELARDFKNLDIFLHALIKNIRLELPPIDPIRGLPALTTDKRLIFKPPPAKKAVAKGFNFRIFYDVKTVAPGAIQLMSKMADPIVPITVDVNNNNKGNSAGYVRIEPFDIKYLRRTVHVERLQIDLAENEDGDFPLGARFRIDQTAYKIFIDLAGTTGSPIVNLNSEPFLPRADIISVLLFDRINDELVSADSDTSSGVQAALADRAIGLFGLWAFATTPIRSFSYNAVTKVYTATVQLADGLTAGVGTNWERAANFEVRKRVSRRWVLTASWAPTDNQSQVGQLVLQWEKRF